MSRKANASTFIFQALLVVCVFSLAAALIVVGSGPALLGLILLPAFTCFIAPLRRAPIRLAAVSGRSRPPSTRAPPAA